jgi:hypothetical protein
VELPFFTQHPLSILSVLSQNTEGVLFLCWFKQKKK